MEKKVFIKGMLSMQRYFGKDLDDDVVEIYWNRLKGLDGEKYAGAILNVMDNFTSTSSCPFPLIKHILEACGEDSATKAVNIVTAVKKAAEVIGQYESVDFGDPALHSVIRRYGGWPEIVLWGENDWQLHERNFIAAYEGAVKAGLKEGYCKGLHEISNGLDGFEYAGPYLMCSKTGRILAVPEKVKRSEITFPERKQIKNKGENEYAIAGTVRGIIAGNNVSAAS